MIDQTRTVPKRQAELLDRIGKVLAMLADIQTALSDGEVGIAEAWLDKLSDAESFVTTYPCVNWPEEEEANEGGAQ